MNRFDRIAKTICGNDWYGPYTPDHVKRGPPRIKRDSGVFEVHFREESLDAGLVKKLNEFADGDLWDLSAEVEWKGK